MTLLCIVVFNTAANTLRRQAGLQQAFFLACKVALVFLFRVKHTKTCTPSFCVLDRLDRALFKGRQKTFSCNLWVLRDIGRLCWMGVCCQTYFALAGNIPEAAWHILHKDCIQPIMIWLMNHLSCGRRRFKTFNETSGELQWLALMDGGAEALVRCWCRAAKVKVLFRASFSLSNKAVIT